MNIKKLDFKHASGPPNDGVYEAIVGDHRYQIANASDINEPANYQIFLSFADSNYEGEIRVGQRMLFDYLDDAKEFAQNDFDQRMNRYFV